MAVTFVGADSGGGNVADIASAANPVTWPAGIQSGDVALVLWIMQNTVTPTIPSGWTVPTGGSVDGLGSSRYRLMWHVCTGSESGTLSLTNSGGTINRQSAALIVYRGLDTTAPIDQLASRSETTAGTTHASPSVTTGVTNAVIWAGAGERSTSGTNGWTPPSGYTERADSTTAATGSGGTIVAGADDGLATSRASGTTVTPGVWTSTNGFSTANVVTWTVSLKPSAVTTVSGSAALSGAGALTPAATVRERAAATLTATGTLGAAAAVRVRAAAALTASGVLAAAGRVRERGSGALTAAGTLTAAGAVRIRAGAALAATGVLAAAGRQRIAAQAAVAASGTLGAAGIQRAAGAATLTATGSLTAAGTRRVPAAADLASAASLAAAGLVYVRASAALTGVSGLSVATGAVTGSAALTATAGMTADGRVRSLAQAVLTGAGGLSALPLVRVRAAAALTASGVLAAGGGQGASRGSMADRARPGPGVRAADRPGSDLHAGDRPAVHISPRLRAGTSMGGP